MNEHDLPWYRRWFNERYREIYSHRDEDEAEAHVEFACRAMGLNERTFLLDLACGAGRHLRFFRRKDFFSVGADLSVNMLRAAETPNVICADMLALPFVNAAFSAVTMFFTSLGYFADDASNVAALREIRRTLRPGGKALLDMANRERLLANLVARDEKELDGKKIVSTRRWDEKKGRVEKTITIGGDAESETFCESVRIPTRGELRLWLDDAGLREKHVFGDFDGEDFAGSSARMIVIAGIK